MNDHICDTRPDRRDPRSTEQNIHYARGFMQGAMFFENHKKSFSTERKMINLLVALLKIREKARQGKDIGFVFQELERKFRLPPFGKKLP